MPKERSHECTFAQINPTEVLRYSIYWLFSSYVPQFTYVCVCVCLRSSECSFVCLSIKWKWINHGDEIFLNVATSYSAKTGTYSVCWVCACILRALFLLITTIWPAMAKHKFSVCTKKWPKLDRKGNLQLFIISVRFFLMNLKTHKCKCPTK